MADEYGFLASKHHAMGVLLSYPEGTFSDAGWRSRYVWLLRSSLEALGETNTPMETVRAYADEAREQGAKPNKSEGQER